MILRDKKKLAVLFIVLLFLSLFVNAGGFSNKNETNITEENIPDMNITNDTNITIVNEINVTIENITDLSPYEPFDLSIKEVYFHQELVLDEEMFVLVDLESNSEEEVKVQVLVSVKRTGGNLAEKKDKKKEKFLFKEKEKFTFLKERTVAFGPIFFEEKGDYEIQASVKSAEKEEEHENNELTGLFFFPFLMCEDGTYYSECNKELLFCDNGKLVENCKICGCEIGFSCVKNECISVKDDPEVIEEKYFIYGIKGLTAEIKGEEIRYYHSDHLGSVRKVTNQNGEVVSSIDYLPFGGKFSKEGEGNYEYTGKEFDDSGLNYYGARYYDSNLGRFITSDPARDGINWYSYVGNNPMNRIDPTGLEKVDVNEVKTFGMPGGFQGGSPDDTVGFWVDFNLEENPNLRRGHAPIFMWEEDNAIKNLGRIFTPKGLMTTILRVFIGKPEHVDVHYGWSGGGITSWLFGNSDISIIYHGVLGNRKGSGNFKIYSTNLPKDYVVSAIGFASGIVGNGGFILDIDNNAHMEDITGPGSKENIKKYYEKVRSSPILWYYNTIPGFIADMSRGVEPVGKMAYIAPFLIGRCTNPHCTNPPSGYIGQGSSGTSGGGKGGGGGCGGAGRSPSNYPFSWREDFDRVI